jgi:aminoglycoside 3-N-acetyltransferase
MSIKKIFELFPRFEVFSRNLFWRFSILQKLKFIFNKSKNKLVRQKSFTGEQLWAALIKAGINQKDILVVHSSMHKLAPMGLTPEEIIDMLINQLCPKGTLVCPAFPIYTNEFKGKDRIFKDISDLTFIYDVQKSRSWTGDLGRALMKMTGSRRSIHPLNTIVAYGKSLSKIFANEKFDNLDLPCGPNSSWAALSKMNAKIIMLGVDLAHSLTMIHVAEDCFEKEWPIECWYRKRHFKILNNGKENFVTVRERHPKWSMSYAERKLSHDLFKEGIAKKTTIGSLEITILESKRLLNFLYGKRKNAYPYYLTWLSSI